MASFSKNKTKIWNPTRNFCAIYRPAIMKQLLIKAIMLRSIVCSMRVYHLIWCAKGKKWLFPEFFFLISIHHRDVSDFVLIVFFSHPMRNNTILFVWIGHTLVVHLKIRAAKMVVEIRPQIVRFVGFGINRFLKKTDLRSKFSIVLHN